jgi:hypothetical protein
MNRANPGVIGSLDVGQRNSESVAGTWTKEVSRQVQGTRCGNWGRFGEVADEFVAWNSKVVIDSTR